MLENLKKNAASVLAMAAYGWSEKRLTTLEITYTTFDWGGIIKTPKMRRAYFNYIYILRFSG